MTAEKLCLDHAKKRRKINSGRTENTIRGSEGLSTERRLTRLMEQDQNMEKENQIKTLKKKSS